MQSDSIQNELDFVEIEEESEFKSELDSLADERRARSSQSFYPYQREIGLNKLLKRNEEIELGRRIQRGDAEALSKLVVSNLRLVISIARSYSGQGLDLDDLVQEGNVGLIQAARKFDPSLGYKFSTYATWWVRQAVARAVANKGRAIRLPVHLRASIQKIRATAKLYHQRLGRFPSREEIAEKTGIPVSEVERLLASNLNMLSLDETNDMDKSAISQISDETGERPEGAAEKYIMRRSIDKLTATLSQTELRVVSLFYGLDAPEMSTQEIAMRLRLPGDEVRRILRRSLKRLKRNLHNRSVEDYL